MMVLMILIVFLVALAIKLVIDGIRIDKTRKRILKKNQHKVKP